MKKWLLQRAKEPTTWIGISMLAGVLGVPPDIIAQGNKIMVALGAIAGVALPENQP